MVTTRVKPRGPFHACKHARTHPRVFVDMSGRNSSQDDGCYLANRFGDVASQLSGQLDSLYRSLE
jgi:hypothetical protein